MFSFFDYQNGDIREIYLNGFMCVVIIIGNLSVFKLGADRMAYCIGINLVSLALIYDVSIGAGSGGGLFWLQVMPLFIFFFFERIEALISTIILFLCAALLLTYPSLFNTHPYELNTGIKYLISLFFVSIIAYGLESSRHKFSRLLLASNLELETHKNRLEKALSDVKTLTGLLPICAHCKKVRDDTGYWNQIETYIQEHSEAEFSHGMCPECSEELYGDKPWFKNMQKKK
ncbi:MAG: hypothetical protein MI802_13530 [Desulfobacterales bacterium]|nr:hypothetical protein [Desulfobacterales bacterium]